MELYQLIDEILLKVSRVIREEKEKVINRDEISKVTYMQFNILYWIDALENPTITDLSNATNMTKPTMTVHIQNLERLGLVYKEKSELDKRKTIVHISEMGKKIQEGENNAFLRLESMVRNKLTAEEADVFRELLEKLNDD